MIIFRSIKLKNFLSYGNNWTEIQLDRFHTTALLGKSGSGKSSITDALSFALFNKAFRNINKAQLVNNINNKDCVVECEFDLNNIRYKIVRGMKPAIFEIYENGKLLNQQSHSLDYQEQLECNILKFNYNTFNKIIVLGLVNFVPFLSMKASERRELIEDLLGIQVFSTMNSLLKNEISDTKKAIERNNIDIINQQEKIDIHQDYINKRKLENENKVVVNKEQIKIHLIDIKNLQKELKEKENNKSKLEKKLIKEDGINKNIEDLLIKKTKIDNDYKQLIDSQDSYEKNKNKIKDIQIGLQQLQSNLDATNKLKDELSEGFVDNNEELKIEYQKFNENYETINLKLKQKEEETLFYNDNIICPTCKRDFDSVQKNILIENNQIKIQEYKEMLDRLAQKRTKIKLKIKDIEETKNKINNINRKLEQINNDITIQINNKNNIETNNKQLLIKFSEPGNIEDILLSLKEQSKSLEDKLVENRDLIKLFKSIKSELINIDTQYRKIERYISISNSKIETLEKENLTILDKLSKPDDSEKILIELNESLKKMEEQKISLYRVQTIQNYTLDILKDNGIKSYLIKQYIPIINKMINRFLNFMNFNVIFTLDENFNETIRGKGKNDLTYDGISNGEKQRLDIAILLTWRSIASMKNNVNTNLLVIDEVLDNSLDVAATENVLELINNEPIFQNSNIFVITHKPELMDKFANNISFEKYKNFSSVIAE